MQRELTTQDYEALMRLPEGKTCSDCRHFRWCDKFLGGNIAANTECDWAPSRFIQNKCTCPKTMWIGADENDSLGCAQHKEEKL